MWSVDLRPARPVRHGLGGRLALALANSVVWRRSDAPIERLPDYAALTEYVAHAGAVPDEVAADLAAAAAAAPPAAAAALRRTVVLREALFRAFSAVAAGGQPDEADLATVSRTLSAGLRRVALDARGRPTWTGLDLPAWEAAADAVALLSAPERGAVKQCPGESCGWLFVDESRNHSRRWCDSTMCGNRERARRHYQRHRAATAD
jgi:predicted RNA-binding Zn ribbon-like protein